MLWIASWVWLEAVAGQQMPLKGISLRPKRHSSLHKVIPLSTQHLRKVLTRASCSSFVGNDYIICDAAGSLKAFKSMM